MNPTTEFDHLMKEAFVSLFSEGSRNNYFKAAVNEDCYRNAVKPDFVIPGRAWIDFKLHVSYRESSDVAWRPSAMYTSLRKYIAHSANETKKLVIVYGQLWGTINDVQFPIMRGKKILVTDQSDFKQKVILVEARKALGKLEGSRHEAIIDKVSRLLHA